MTENTPARTLSDQRTRVVTMRSDRVVIDYTNHRGERRERRVVPEDIWFGSSKFHKGAQWFLRAFDAEKQAVRDFAMADVHAWKHDPHVFDENLNDGKGS